MLDALELVLVEQGLAGLTLEHVAERAGVSKGGLLYHFPSKAKLVDGLFDRLDALLVRAVADAPTEPGEVVRWFVETSAWPSEEETNLYRALTAVLRSGDDLETDRLRRIFASYAEPVRRTVDDPVLVEAVRLVGDGLFLSRLLGFAPPERTVVDAMVEDFVARATATR